METRKVGIGGLAVSRLVGSLAILLGCAIGAYAFIPDPPSLMAPEEASILQPTTVQVSWSWAPGATGYRLQVSTAENFATTVFDESGIADQGQEGTSHTVPGLANNTTYYWRALSESGEGPSSWTDPFTFTTIIDAPALSSPANGAADRPVTLTLNWGAVDGADSYSVLVSTAADFSSTVFIQNSTVTTSQAVTNLDNSTSYHWKVHATSDAGNGDTWSSAWSFTTIVAPPDAPALLTPADNATDQPVSQSFTWSAGTRAESYTIQVSDESGFSTTVTSQGGITATTASIDALANSTQYFWRVRSDNPGGDAWSSVRSFTTILAPPAAPSLSSPANGATDQPLSLSLTWNSSATAETYILSVSTVQDFSSTIQQQNGLSETTAPVTVPFIQTTYFWRVKATNAGGTGSWTSTWSFTTIPAPPSRPSLVQPVNNDANQSTTPTLLWYKRFAALSYGVQVSKSATFSTLEVSQSGITDTVLSVGPIANNTKYYWRVNAVNTGGTGLWALTWNFTVPNTPAAVTLSTPTNGDGNVAADLSLSWQASARPPLIV